jgi:hypothetical protein
VVWYLITQVSGQLVVYIFKDLGLLDP